MGKELYECSAAAKAVFELCDSIRPGTSEQCFNGTKEELTVTANTQPDMFAVEVAAARALVEAGIQPDALAGFSLGEISALAFSGAVSLEDGFKLVCRRGELMQEASNAADSAMVAVVKLPPEKVEELAVSKTGRAVTVLVPFCSVVVAGRPVRITSSAAGASNSQGSSPPFFPLRA